MLLQMLGELFLVLILNSQTKCLNGKFLYIYMYIYLFSIFYICIFFLC